MTATETALPSGTDGEAGTAASDAPPGPPSLLRRWRTRLVITLFVVVVGVLVVLARPGTTAGALDPASPTPEGSRAVAQVLGDQGVEVRSTTRYADVVDTAGEGDATVLVVGADLLTEPVLDSLRADLASSDLVLVQPSGVLLEDLGLDLTAAAAPGDGPAPADCDLPAARAAGEVEWGSSAGYQVAPDADEPDDLTWCFPEPRAEAPNGRLVVWEDGDRRVTLLGSPEPLTNELVDEPGNAALALQLLGEDRELVWWKVDPADPGLLDGARPSPFELMPPATFLIAWWLVGVAALAVLWRARRMGRLVPEPLPVVVRSAETARGRGALYRESGARDRAAQVLRADAVRRLALRLGLPASTPAPEVVSQAAARSGPQGAWVRDVLAGPPPADDLVLAQLADALDHVVGDPADRGSTSSSTSSSTSRSTDRKAPST